MSALLDNIIPLFAILMIFGIPMVAILTAHQRRMAEMTMQQRSQSSNSEVMAMRQEIMELKQLVHQLAISVDSLATRPATPPTPTIQERIEQGSR